jgi:hypothetical protein
MDQCSFGTLAAGLVNAARPADPSPLSNPHREPFLACCRGGDLSGRASRHSRIEGLSESGDAKKLKQLEDENRKLKHVVAELKTCSQSADLEIDLRGCGPYGANLASLLDLINATPAGAGLGTQSVPIESFLRTRPSYM